MDIQKITKKLKELSKLDVETLKDIDYSRLKDDILRRNDVLINTLAIIATVLAMFVIFNNKRGDLKNLTSSVHLLEQKIEAKNKLLKIKSELKNFIENISDGIPEDKLITLLNSMAIASNVKITNFSPAEAKNFKLFKTTNINLEVTADSYFDMWDFIHTIEDSGYALIVTSWKGRSSQQRTSGRSTRRDSTEGSDTQFTSQVIVRSVDVIKND